MSCPVPMWNEKRRGEACGRRVVGFVAPGEGRCGFHLGPRERARVRKDPSVTARAAVQAIREMRALRAMQPDREAEHEEEPQRHDETNRGARDDFPGPGFTELRD